MKKGLLAFSVALLLIGCCSVAGCTCQCVSEDPVKEIESNLYQCEHGILRFQKN